MWPWRSRSTSISRWKAKPCGAWKHQRCRAYSTKLKTPIPTPQQEKQVRSRYLAYVASMGIARPYLDAAYATMVRPGSHLDVYVNGRITSSLAGAPKGSTTMDST